MSFAKLGTVSALALAISVPSIASAADASAVTDLNIRSGPANSYAISGVIPAGESAMIDGCVEDGSWCKVTYDGTEGWSYAPYLTVNVENEAYVVTERPSTVEINTVTYEDAEGTAANETAGATTGAVIGSLAAYAVGGPVGGIVAGGVLGSAAGAAAAEPSTETVTYIESNPVETVYLDGEVAVGAGVPQSVTTYEIPNYDYRYATINGQTVLVDASSGAIVRVLR
jgi:uncharacterized protein YraI